MAERTGQCGDGMCTGRNCHGAIGDSCSQFVLHSSESLIFVVLSWDTFLPMCFGVVSKAHVKGVSIHLP